MWRMEGVGHGGWREWDVKGVKNVKYVINVENVEIIKGRDAVKVIPSF